MVGYRRRLNKCVVYNKGESLQFVDITKHVVHDIAWRSETGYRTMGGRAHSLSGNLSNANITQPEA